MSENYTYEAPNEPAEEAHGRFAILTAANVRLEARNLELHNEMAAVKRAYGDMCRQRDEAERARWQAQHDSDRALMVVTAARHALDAVAEFGTENPRAISDSIQLLDDCVYRYDNPQMETTP